MGQCVGLIPSGSQGVCGQTYGQCLKCGRRGVEGTKNSVVGPTVVARNHHQSGWCGCGAAAAGVSPPLQPTLGEGGALSKISKNETKVGP